MSTNMISRPVRGVVFAKGKRFLLPPGDEDAARLFYVFLKDEDDLEKVFGEFLARSPSSREYPTSERQPALPTVLEVPAHNHVDHDGS